MAGDDIQSKAAELVKRALTVGVGAVFLTEESLRSMVSELKLPKELIAGLLESANKTKNDFFQKLSSDIIERVSNRLDPQALVAEFLQKNEVEFTVKVNVKPRKKQTKESGEDEEKEST